MITQADEVGDRQYLIENSFLSYLICILGWDDKYILLFLINSLIFFYLYFEFSKILFHVRIILHLTQNALERLFALISGIFNLIICFSKMNISLYCRVHIYIN